MDANSCLVLHMSISLSAADMRVLSLQPPMSTARRTLVDKAFQKLDRTGDGYVTIHDLKGAYNVTHHPKFKSGDWTRKQVSQCECSCRHGIYRSMHVYVYGVQDTVSTVRPAYMYTYR